MKDLVIKGQITSTSKKQSEKFPSSTPQKTAYLKLDAKNAKLAQEFGLQEYTPKDGGEPYFMVKVVEKLRAYYDNSNECDKLDTSIETPNFKTPDGVEIGLALVQGESKGNTFYRLSAVKLSKSSDIENLEATNPFA